MIARISNNVSGICLPNLQTLFPKRDYDPPKYFPDSWPNLQTLFSKKHYEGLNNFPDSSLILVVWGISFYPRTFLPPVAALFDSIIRHYEGAKNFPDLYRLFLYIPNLSNFFLGFSNTFITFLLCFYGGIWLDK